MSESVSAPVEGPAQGIDWKAEARKWEDRSKENRAAVESLTTERDKLAAELDELRTAKDELAAKVQGFEESKRVAELAASVAADSGVPVALLRGETEEELRAHADQLKDVISASSPAPVVAGQAKSPEKVLDDPEREFVRNLFSKSDD